MYSSKGKGFFSEGGSSFEKSRNLQELTDAMSYIDSLIVEGYVKGEPVMKIYDFVRKVFEGRIPMDDWESYRNKFSSAISTIRSERLIKRIPPPSKSTTPPAGWSSEEDGEKGKRHYLEDPDGESKGGLYNPGGN